MRAITLSLALAVSLVLPACAVTEAGVAVAPPEVAKRHAKINVPLQAKEAFGDVATIDFCSLFYVGDYPEKLGYITEPPTTWFENCVFQVHRDGWETQVNIGYLTDDPADRKSSKVLTRPKRHRSITVRTVTDERMDCERQVVLSDGYSIQVDSVTWAEGDTSGGPVGCSVVEHTVDQVIEHLLAGPVGHIEAYADESLVGEDVCGLVPSATLSEVLGGTAVKSDRPGGHWCQLTRTRGGDTAAVVRRVVTRLLKDENSDGQEVRVLKMFGRTTELTRGPLENGGVFCKVLTQYADYPALHNAFESLSVSSAGASENSACGQARAFASKIWPKLPKPPN